MFAIQKLRITVASNGAFKCNGLLVKTPTGCSLVTPIPFLSLSDVTGNGTRSLEMAEGSSLQFAEPVHVYAISECDGSVYAAADGFVTAALMLEYAPGTGAYRYELTGGVRVTSPSEAVAFNFSEEFAEEEARNCSVSGVAFKDGYARRVTYSGIAGYHHHDGRNNFNEPLTQDKPWKIGVELECYARSNSDYRTITQASSNWFQCEHDSSLQDNSRGIEIKTIPLNACDAKSVDFWAEPMARLKQLATSKGSSTTGLHVHIGKEILGRNDLERQKTLDKLTWFYYYIVEDVPENHAKNVTICGRERGYGTREDAGKTDIADFAKEVGFEAVQKSEAAFTRMAGGVKEKLMEQRDDINLKPLNTYGTIEFRKGKGCIGKTRIAALITWWEQMCLYCRETRPSELSFDAFFSKIIREYPAVAYFFQQEDEA